MKPGDLIEWVYKSNREVVVSGEELWSTPLERWVPIGSEQVHLLISITDETIVWLNDKGLFHAHVNDAARGLALPLLIQVVPHARG